MTAFREKKTKSQPSVRKEDSGLGKRHNTVGIRGRRDAPGIEKVEGMLGRHVLLVRHVSMPEEDGVRPRLEREIFKSIKTVLRVVEIAVSEHYPMPEKLYLLGLHSGGAFEDAREIAIAPDRNPRLVGIVDRERVGIRETVAEEEYDLRVGMEGERSGKKRGITVRIGKNKTFHIISLSAVRTARIGDLWEKPAAVGESVARLTQAVFYLRKRSPKPYSVTEAAPNA